MNTRWLIGLTLAVTVAAAGCSKEEPPQAAKEPAPAAQPQMPASHPPAGGEGMMGAPAGPREVVVPEDVQKTWKAVVLAVSERDGDKSQDVTIEIGKTATVGDLEITVESFLPSFSMGGGTITSSSADTLNPAARLMVKEKGNEVFAGWLFSMYPDAHPFTHEKYNVVLKDFVKK
jgi:hypothetical protein